MQIELAVGMGAMLSWGWRYIIRRAQRLRALQHKGT